MGESGLNVIPLSFAAIGFTFLRSAFDAYGVLGFGHYLMSSSVKPSRLFTISVLAGAASVLARFFPVSPVSQAYLCALFMFALSVWTKTSSLQTSAGAALMGTGSLLILEHVLEQALILLGRYPRDPGLLDSLVRLAPSSVLLAVMAHLSVTRLRRFPPLFTPPEGDRPETLDAEPSGEFGPIARLFSALVLVIAFTGDVQRADVPLWVFTSASLTLPFFLFGLIMWASSHGTKPFVSNLQITPVDLLDLGLLPALTHTVLVLTGGVGSPYLALHIPLVVANSLKKGPARGFISAVLSLLSITIVGFRAWESVGSWTTNSNFTMGLVYVLTFYVTNRFSSTEADLKKRLVEKATTDDLTDLYNHGFAHTYLDRLLDSREGRTYLLMIDLDNFKMLNDSLGHVDGDMVLKEIAANLKRVVRAGDVVARYGGDEFMVIPKRVTSEEQACALGERLRRAIEQTCEQFVAAKGLQHMSSILTASCGIAYTSELVRDKDSLIRAADKALYSAKAQGKNRAVMAG